MKFDHPLPENRVSNDTKIMGTKNPGLHTHTVLMLEQQ